MTDIYLCRHGRTQLNVAGLLRGHLDPDLDLVGHAEARDLARQLRNVGLVRVISSPLARALDTARPIAEASEVALETDERLIDRAYGEFDGRSTDDVTSEYGSVDAAPGVETAEAVAARAKAVLNDLINAENEGPVPLHIGQSEPEEHGDGPLMPGWPPAPRSGVRQRFRSRHEPLLRPNNTINADRPPKGKQ